MSWPPLPLTSPSRAAGRLKIAKSVLLSCRHFSGEHLVKAERSEFNQGDRLWFQLLRAPACLHVHPVQVLPIARSHSRQALIPPLPPPPLRLFTHTQLVYSKLTVSFCHAGLPYSMAIDMWSFGCILAELYTGYPLFPGENEVEQLACIMEIFGLPSTSLLADAQRKKLFFGEY